MDIMLSRLIVIRRGDSVTLNAILQSRGRWPVRTALMMDRRERERRVLQQQMMIERRQRQRRMEPGSMWHTHGFIVAETYRLPMQAVALDEAVE
jgi:hypothetical protein